MNEDAKQAGSNIITILTSGSTLGVHVPGLLLASRLRERGVPAKVTVLESMLPPDKLAVTANMRLAYHRSFKFALAAKSLGRDTSADLDEVAVQRLWTEWRDQDIRHFVVFSGFWLPVLRRYREFAGFPICVDLCRGDAAPMQSFMIGGAGPPEGVREIHLADIKQQRLPWTIPVSRKPPIPWSSRDERLLVHGGGWGLGTYRERADELSQRGFALDVVAYEPDDVEADRLNVRYFMIDPQWHPWHDDGYPPFVGCAGEPPPHFTSGRDYPQVFDLARRALAIVSKPGAGTLLDSLWSATPLIMIEPWTESEKKNAELWQNLGYGISIEEWQAAKFSVDLLAALHEKLVPVAPTIPDYSAALEAEVLGSARIA